MTDITELAPAMKAAAELITSGYSRKWIVSHDDETCWVGANDDDGNLTPFIEVSIADWSGNKVDNETLARFISLCRPANILALVEALEKAQAAQPCEHSMFWDASGVKRCSKCDLPEHANVHYADAAEMEIAALRQRIAELESFHTAYMEWSAKTDWVQTDKRFDVLKPWGKHRADVLKAYIEHLESRTVTAAAADVLAERQRQVTAEGWAPAHDDEYEHGELADAAGCYALSSELFDCAGEPPRPWPWPDEWWKPTSRRRDLVKAGALILAEIERIDRAAGVDVKEAE
ncbi:TPA: ead/Ea22-like family protein [Klebsiella oxytoca]|nr:ead/Ea22-like family protein [Klebsiella oxytoca]